MNVANRREEIRLPLCFPTLLAPMEGVTDPIFRDVIAANGSVGLVCTEFVRITKHPVSRRRLRREVVKPPKTPLSVQVMGNDALRMAEAAEAVEQCGADAVDINLGCPAPRVVRKGVGSAMLRDLGLLGEVLAAMRARVRGLLSAKIRAGFDRADRAVEIARIVEDCGFDFLTVHPRRRVDFFEGVADWRIIKTIREAVRIPVVGNGDVWYAADALRLEAETGCAAVMIGRPAVRNPWIFSQIQSLRTGERPVSPSGDDLFRHLEGLARAYEEKGLSPKGLAGKLKEHCGYLSRTVPDGGTLRRALLRSQSADELLSLAASAMRPLAPGDIDLGATGEGGLERSGSTGSSPEVTANACRAAAV